MNITALKPLFVQAVKDPRGAADTVLATRWPAQALWIALSLVSVVTSLIVAALVQATPLPQGELGALLQASPVYSSPLIFAVMQWGRAVLSVFMLFWVGRALGGRGALEDVLGVVTLVQIVSFALVAGITLVGVIFPFLSSLGLLVFFVWWVWAVANALDVAHSYENPMKAFGVMVISIFGVLIGLSIFMGIVGGLAAGLTGAR